MTATDGCREAEKQESFVRVHLFTCAFGAQNHVSSANDVASMRRIKHQMCYFCVLVCMGFGFG